MLAATDRLDLYEILIEHEFLLKLIVSALLGAIVGLERERSHKPAGLRTHILVSMGATLYVSLSLFLMEGFAVGERRMADPNRVLAQIVTGVSFLGAGTIFQSRGSIRGLTTAASIWIMAAVGSAVGAGHYVMAVTTTLIAFLVLNLLTIFVARILPRRESLSITVKGQSTLDHDGIRKRLESYSDTIRISEARSRADLCQYTFQIQIDDDEIPKMVSEIQAIAGVEEVRTK